VILALRLLDHSSGEELAMKERSRDGSTVTLDDGQRRAFLPAEGRDDLRNSLWIAPCARETLRALGLAKHIDFLAHPEARGLLDAFRVEVLHVGLNTLVFFGKDEG
jgi:hypothetical protein